ncbi:hypothetical protein IW262DRAFT_1452906 [Armillaria fumosa]|nr:hypothetical protein IW262DRAFT_1452906 [Armillaria fumosa]
MSISDASSLNAGGQYLAFVPLHEDKATGKHGIYNINGTRTCQTDNELVSDQDTFSEAVLDLTHEYIKELSAGGSLEFEAIGRGQMPCQSVCVWS